VIYQSNPPPPDPPPPDPPLPDDPPPDDPPNNPQPVVPELTALWVGVGAMVTATGVVTSVYVLRNKPKFKRKVGEVKQFFSKMSSNKQKSESVTTLENIKVPRSPTDSLHIIDVKSGMKNISIQGKLERVERVRSFVRRNGTTGRVGTIELSDETGTIRIIFWDEKCSCFTQGRFSVGNQVKIINAYSKINTYYGKNNIEIHLGKFSRLEYI
jgi:ssDNA-binding replication factor A large subunit